MVKTLVAIVLGLCLVAPVIAAAPVQPKAVAQTKPAKPEWSELTAPQQMVLASLKDDWKELDSVRRAKWVKVANAYPKMKPEQQQRLQTQMRDWAKLTPEQRRVARKISNHPEVATRETQASDCAMAAISTIPYGQVGVRGRKRGGDHRAVTAPLRI